MSQLQPVTHFPLPKNDVLIILNMKKEKTKKDEVWED